MLNERRGREGRGLAREGDKNGNIKNNSDNQYKNDRCNKNVLQGETDHLTKGERNFGVFS